MDFIQLLGCHSRFFGAPVNSGVGRLPVIKKEIAIYGFDDRMRVSLSRR
jgi:hypothetical protein